MLEGGTARAILMAAAVLIGFSTPPHLIENTLSNCFLASGTVLKNELQNELQSLGGSDFTLSLEWALFNPRQGLCLKEIDVLQTAGENLVSNDSSPLNDEDSHVHANTSLDFKHFNSFLLSSTLDTDYSITQAFDYTTIVYEVGLELETVSLVSESEFDGTASYLRLHHYRSTLSYGDLLNSYWNEWTYHMGPNLGLTCVTVMYGCVLCTALYHLWARTTTSKALALKFQSLYGVNLNSESQLSILTLERDTLLTKLLETTTHADSLQDLLNSLSKELHDITKHNAHLKLELAKKNDDLKHIKLMKSMSYKRSKMSEDKFKLERAQWKKTKESLVSEYEKLVEKYIADKEAEMTNVKRELEGSKRQETDTKNLVMLAEEHMERKRKEWLNIEKQMMANRTILIEDRNYIEAELLNTKKALERSELLEFEAQTKLILDEESLEQERNEWLNIEKQMMANRTILIEDRNYIEAELLNTKKALERSELLEFEAQTKLILDEESLEQERKEWLNIEKQMMANRTILIEDRNYIEAELLNTKKALERSEVLEFEAQTKLILDEESLEQERSDWKETKEALLNKNTELADKYTALETELLDTKKALERSEIHKFEGQQKLVLAEEHMNRESEAMKELLTLECTKFEKKNSAQKTELQSIKKQLEKNKCLEIELQAKLRSTEEALKRKERSLQALKRVEATEEKQLKLAREEIALLKRRRSAVPHSPRSAHKVASGRVDAVDSGISSEPDLSSHGAL
ncbi:myosin-9-like [Halichondria panicea]|uniref:myosin-9-like n=1 Tax=Halichondria panicea TaxID=6063 RepID=UPI00312B82D1